VIISPEKLNQNHTFCYSRLALLLVTPKCVTNDLPSISAIKGLAKGDNPNVASHC